MAESFEKAGLELEIRGFEDYIKQLGRIVDKQDETAASADLLAEKFTNLELKASAALKAINNSQFNPNSMGVGKFGEAITKAAGNIEAFERVTQNLLQNTGSLQAGFDHIRNSIENIDMEKLSTQATKAADSIEKLAVAMGALEKSMGGNKLVTNLGKLIPLLLAAGEIRKLGDVGIGIRSIISNLAKIDKIPDFDKNQKNFNALISFVEKLSKLKISPSLGSDLIEIGNALVKFAPGLKEINKVSLQQHTVDGIEKLLLTFQKYSGMDISGLGPLADAIGKLGVGFRSFAAGGEAGKKFSATALAIADAVDHLLNSLNKFVSQQDADKFIKLIGELGDSLRKFGQGAATLGRDFANTFANVPESIDIIVNAIQSLKDQLNDIADLGDFVNRIDTISKGISQLTIAFQKLGRSESIRKNLRDQVKAIIDVLVDLGRDDLQAAAKNIQALVGPITDLSNALKLLKGQKVAKGLADNINQIGSGFERIFNIGAALAGALFSVGRSLLTVGAAIGKIGITALVNTFRVLINIIGALATAIIKLPFQIITIGFRTIVFAVQAVIAPIRFLIGLLGTLGQAFNNLFRSRTANVSASLGLKEAQGDIAEFETRMGSLRGSFGEVNNYTNSARSSILDFGQSADRASQDVNQLDQSIDRLNNNASTLNRVFSGGELLRIAGTFKAVDIAVDLVTDSLYGMIYGFQSLIGEAIQATSRFEQLTLQLTSLQAKEVVGEGLFPDVPTALTEGVEVLQERVNTLTNEFRILAIQSPFETDDVANAFRLAQAFGFSTDEARELTRTLVDAGSALGFTGNDLQEVARVFGQIRTTGKLMAQDLNQLASRGIGVKQMFAEMGITAEQLAESTVNADDAIQVILRTLQRDFAGAAARSASSIEGLIGSFGSFREEALRTFAQPIVEGLRPIFVGLSDTLFTTEVFDKIEAAGEQAFAVIERVFIAISSVAGIVSDVFSRIPQPFIDFLALLGQSTGVAIAATTAFVGLAFVIGTLAAVISFALLNPFGQVAAITFVVHRAVTALTSELMTAGQTIEAIGVIIRQAFDLQTVETQILRIAQLPEAVQPIVSVINNLTVQFSKIITVLQQFGNVFAEAFSLDVIGLMGAILDLDEALRPIGYTVAEIGLAFGRFYSYITTFATGIYNNVISVFSNLDTTIITIFNNIVTGVSGIIDAIFSTANNISSFLSTLIQNVGEFGVGVVQAFASGMEGAVNLVVQAVEAIASAITWLLAPGSPPRALPEIDTWGTAAAQEFLDGFGEADTNVLLDLANGVQESLGNIKLPSDSTLQEIFNTMQWSTDDAGNVVDSIGNIVVTQDELAKAASTAADELERVNAELEALEREQSIQKQQNLVDTLKNALRQPNLSDSNRMVLEQQLKRAELELRRLQLEAEQEGIVPEDGTGIGGGRGRTGTGGKTKTPKVKTPKGIEEPEQKFPKIDKAVKKTGKALKEALDLAIPDTSGIANAFGDPATGTGLLGRITEAFNNAKENIGGAISGIRETIIGIFTDIRDKLKLIIAEIVRLAGEFATAFSEAFGTLENQGPIVGAIAALGTATVLSGGWGVLLTIAAGIAAIGSAWAIASGQVNLQLPESLGALQDEITKLRQGFAEAKGYETTIGEGLVIKSEGMTLAETILGFKFNDFSRSLGALLAKLGEAIAGIFVEIDTALGKAFVAYDAGENPVLAFFDSLFDIGQITQTVTTELQGVGELISSIFTGELAKAFSGEQEAFYDASIGSWNVREVSIGEDSFIVQFIFAQIDAAKELLSQIDWETEFAEIRTNIETGLNNLFGGTEITGENSFLTKIQNFITEIQKLEIVDWQQISSDMQELGKAFRELMGFGDEDTGATEGGEPGGAVVTATGILLTALVGLIETLTKVPSVAESAIQIVDSTIRAIGELITAIGSLGTPTESLDAFGRFGTELGNIFDELGEINTDVFLVVNETLREIVAIVGLMQGVEDVDAFVESQEGLLLGLNGLAGFLVAVAEMKLVSLLPNLLAFNKNTPTIQKVFYSLTAISYAAKEFDRQNEDIDWEGMTNFIDNLTTFLLVQQTLSTLTGGLIGGKGATKIWQQLTKIGMFKAIDTFIKGITIKSVASGAINNLKKLGPLLTGTVFPTLRTIFEKAKWFTTNNLIPKIAAQIAKITPFLTMIWGSITTWIAGIGSAIAGASAATIAAWAAVILAVVGTIIGLVEAFRKDIGGIRTDFLEDWNALVANIQQMWNGLVGMFTNIGNPKEREQAAKEFNEAWKSILGNLWEVISYIVPGTTNNTELIMATVEGFVSFFDGIFGTNFAQNFKNFFDPIRIAIDELGSVSAVAERGVQNIQLMFLKLIAINLKPLDGLILTILGLVDSLRLFATVQLERVSLAVQILAELTAFAANPALNLHRIPTIGALINEFSNLETANVQIDSFRENYQSWLEEIRNTEFVAPKISVEPEFIGPLAENQERGFPTLQSFGNLLGLDTEQAEVVSVPLSPEISVDNTTLNTALTTIETDTTTKLTGLNTTISTNTAALHTQLGTDYAAIATTIGQAGIDGATGFVTGLSTLPTDVETPLGELLAKIGEYGGESGEITVAGQTLGGDFADGYIQGVQSREGDLIAAITTFTNVALNTLPKVQQSGSPSKITFAFGQDYGDGFIKGAASRIPQAVKVGTAIVNAAVGGMEQSVKSSRNQAAINRVLAALIPDVFKDKGLLLDFSNWEIVADSETDVAKRATEKATDIAEQFGNSFARVTNQIFDSLIGFDPSLAPDFFVSEDINKVFTEQVDAILKHRDDTLAQLNAQGKEQFNRNFLAAFIDPEGVKKVAQDFLAQFSDKDLLNLPKVYGAIDSFVGGLRARLEQRAQEGDGWAMSMIGGLDNLNQALRDGVQVAIDEASKEGEELAQSGTNVGSAVTSNIAAGTVAPESLGGLNSSVTTLTTTLITTIQTEFAKITEIVAGQGNASATGFIDGVATLKETLPTTKDELITLLTGFSEEFQETGRDLGEDFGDGYVTGILETLTDIYNAAFKAGQEAKRGMQDGQNSASPSKVSMALGEDFGDGYVIGILSSLNAVRDAGYEMTAAAAQSINDGFNDSAPILTNALQGAVKQGSFWIDENVKFEPPDPEPVEEVVESMNALERATEQASKIFDTFGESFNTAFDDLFDRFLELNPDAIENIWDIEPIREAGTQVAEQLRDVIESISEELTPEGQSSFGELIKSLFGDEEAIATLVESFINSFDPDELATLPDAAAAIDTFIRQIEDVFLEDDEFEGWLRDSGIADDVVSGLTGLTERLKEEIQTALDAIREAEEEASEPVRTWIDDMFGPVPDETETLGEELTAGIAAGITSPTSINALAGAAQIAINSFLNELRNAGEIHSPSRLTMKLAGEPLVDGIIVGMRNRMPTMLKTARTIGDTVAHSFGSGDWLRQNTLDQSVNLKYNGLVNTLPELFQSVNRKVIGGASRLKDDMLMSGEYNARTGMLTNYSVINNTTHSQDEYHLHMDVDKKDLRNVRKGFRVARQLGIK
jgi:tape measure domain-containing protein